MGTCSDKRRLPASLCCCLEALTSQSNLVEAQSAWFQHLRIANQVKLLQALDHPNIIKYMDSFIVDNELIIQLEFAEGGDLGALIEQRRREGGVFEELEIWSSFVQVRAGEHVHATRLENDSLKIVKNGNFNIVANVNNSGGLALSHLRMDLVAGGARPRSALACSTMSGDLVGLYS